MLRKPIDRAISHYKYHVREGIEALSFDDAIACEEDRIKNSYISWFNYVNNGMYYKHITNYCKIFGKERIRIILFDDFVLNTLNICRDIFNFLEVNADYIPKIIAYNQSGTSRYPIMDNMLRNTYIVKLSRKLIPFEIREKIFINLKKWNLIKSSLQISNNMKKKLIIPFEKDVQNLSKLLNRNLDDWLI